ncbi:hypothetical protein F5884DRAFT_323150 [Xylogone sp. PMI_703]|nr:hypothetical protein F5884DRAFT_323150 [Xylogone sp. PMI_703]
MTISPEHRYAQSQASFEGVDRQFQTETPFQETYHERYMTSDFIYPTSSGCDQPYQVTARNTLGCNPLLPTSHPRCSWVASVGNPYPQSTTYYQQSLLSVNDVPDSNLYPQYLRPEGSYDGLSASPDGLVNSEPSPEAVVPHQESHSAMPFSSQPGFPDFFELGFNHSSNPHDNGIGCGLSLPETSSNPRTLPTDDPGSPHRGTPKVVPSHIDEQSEEPYAKLIYRALMSTPNHSMALQDIYRWVRTNTSKGSNDSKGWMNSIRHNLSMNAAFQKSERKMATGSETKKSTEWVLADFAIRDGVQSTTRYRKGATGKHSTRSRHPIPARQISGRKGGLCAGKSKSQKRRVTSPESSPRKRIRSSEVEQDENHHQYNSPYDTASQGFQSHRDVSPPSPYNESLDASSAVMTTMAYQIPFYYMGKYESFHEVQAGDPYSPVFYEPAGGRFSNPHPIWG